MALQIGYGLIQEQRMKLVMTPELRQAIQLLQLSAADLEQYIHEQLEENPVLEIAEPGKGRTARKPVRFPCWTQIPGNGWRMFSETGGGSGDYPAARMRGFPSKAWLRPPKRWRMRWNLSCDTSLWIPPRWPFAVI